MISSVQELADSTPPVDNKLSRFGNPAFRDFYDKVTDVSVAVSLHRLVSLSGHAGGRRS